MRTTKKLYQWDTDQKLIDCVGKYVDYPIGGGVYRIDVIDKECIIPDELLQVSGTVKVYECMEYGTVKAYAFYINPRPKPPDYVFTPTERLTFEGLVKKVDETIEDLQKRADSGEFNGSDYVITESDYDAIAAKTAGKLQPTVGELARTLETEKTDREKADDSLRQDISGKLPEPAEGLSVGKYFRVAQIDENGHAVLEAVDAKTIGVQDVKINGDSIVADGVANVPIAGVDQPGLVGLDNGFGITCVDGKAYPAERDANEYKNSSVYLYVSKGTLDNVLANPSIMPALTSDEQAAARERMGIPGDYELIASAELTEDVALVDIREDINGESLNLQSCVVRLETPICDSNRNMWLTAFPHLNSTNVDTIRYNATVLRTIENIVLCKFNECGLVIPYLTSFGGIQHANVLPSYTTNYIIKRVSFTGASGAPLPSGLKVYVYGVRV